jgi:biopolymer transport protein ExbD
MQGWLARGAGNLVQIAVNDPDISHSNIVKEPKIRTVPHSLSQHAAPLLLIHAANPKSGQRFSNVLGAVSQLGFMDLHIVTRKKSEKYQPDDHRKNEQ